MLRILGVSLANAHQFSEVLISTIDNDDYVRTGACEFSFKESIDQFRTVSRVDVLAYLREVEEGSKGSLRSETVDAGEIARLFGGSGHKLAAGYTRLGMRPAEAKEEPLKTLEGSTNLGDPEMAERPRKVLPRSCDASPTRL